MKKFLFASASALLMAFSGFAASADIIDIPRDSFFLEHDEDISYIQGRYFLLDSETDVYSSPDGSVIGSLSAGKSPRIENTYTDRDGHLWGAFWNRNGSDKYSWINLDSSELIYDGISFEEDHMNEFTAIRSGEYASLTSEGPVCLWEYPGSTEIICAESFPDDFGSYISESYTDENGYIWGYIGYMWGMKGWIFIDDPQLSDLSRLCVTETQAQEIQTDAVEETSPAETFSEEITASVESASAVTTESIAVQTDESVFTVPETTAAVSSEAVSMVTEESESVSAAVTSESIPDSVFTEDSHKKSFIAPAALTFCAMAVSLILIKLVGKKK